jgi:hypothetical protein
VDIWNHEEGKGNIVIQTNRKCETWKLKKNEDAECHWANCRSQQWQDTYHWLYPLHCYNNTSILLRESSVLARPKKVTDWVALQHHDRWGSYPLPEGKKVGFRQAEFGLISLRSCHLAVSPHRGLITFNVHFPNVTFQKNATYIHTYIHACTHACTCMYVCVLYMYAHTYICVDVYTYVCVCILCIYVYMYVFMYIYTYVCVCILCIYVYMYVFIYIYTYVCLYIMYLCIYVHIYICMFVYYVFMYICMCLCTYIHMYVCTYVHAHKFTCLAVLALNRIIQYCSFLRYTVSQSLLMSTFCASDLPNSL